MVKIDESCLLAVAKISLHDDQVRCLKEMEGL
jgi:hypothetical protein